MPSTEVTRGEMLEEYVVRDAIANVGNRIAGLLYAEDEDIFNRLPSGRSDGLLEDPRLEELFQTLFPKEDSAWSPESWTASSESCALSAQILRAIVYNAEHLRGEADHLFRLAREHRAKANDG